MGARITHLPEHTRGAAAYGPYGSRAYGEAHNPRTGVRPDASGSNVWHWGSTAVRRDDWAQTAHVQNYRQGTTTSGIRNDNGAGAVTRTDRSGSRTTVVERRAVTSTPGVTATSIAATTAAAGSRATAPAGEPGRRQR